MKRALIDPKQGRVAQIVALGEEFPVAKPLIWVDAPADAKADASEWDGARVSSPTATAKTITTAATQGELLVNSYILTAGGSIPMHTHTDRGHSTDVLRGEVEIDRSGKVTRLKAGERTTFDIDEPHEIRAVTDAVVVNITG